MPTTSQNLSLSRCSWRSVVVRSAAGLGIFCCLGADCVAGVGIGEAADCCECLAAKGPGGDDSGADANCLPDDLSQGLDAGIEEQQCSADAADAITGAGRVAADAECRRDGHPCADICTAAAKNGVFFIDK